MKKYIYVFLLFFLCCACSRGKYYISNAFRKGTSDKMEPLQLDSTYQFYLRHVYRDKNRQMENVLKANVENKDTANKTLIEVEYLLFSWVHRNVIYISTIPDKFQHYYSFFLYGLLTFNWSLTTDFKQMKGYLKRKLSYGEAKSPKVLWTTLVITKIIYFSVWIAIPMILGIAWWQVLIGFFVMIYTIYR